MNVLGDNRKVKMGSVAPPVEAAPTAALPVKKSVSWEVDDEPPSPKKKRKSKRPSPWMEHVKAYRAANPTVGFKDALKNCKTTYVKKPKVPQEEAKSVQ